LLPDGAPRIHGRVAYRYLSRLVRCSYVSPLEDALIRVAGERTALQPEADVILFILTREAVVLDADVENARLTFGLRVVGCVVTALRNVEPADGVVLYGELRLGWCQHQLRGMELDVGPVSLYCTSPQVLCANASQSMVKPNVAFSPSSIGAQLRFDIQP
jgi:hypothetical protein